MTKDSVVELLQRRTKCVVECDKMISTAMSTETFIQVSDFCTYCEVRTKELSSVNPKGSAAQRGWWQPDGCRTKKHTKGCHKPGMLMYSL